MGEGCKQEYSEALDWFTAAAEQGNPAAQVNLGEMYQTAKGVPLNYVEAYAWFSLAAAQGYHLAADAKKNIVTIMTGKQLAAAELQASEWQRHHRPELQQASQQSHPPEPNEARR